MDQSNDNITRMSHRNGSQLQSTTVPMRKASRTRAPSRLQRTALLATTLLTTAVAFSPPPSQTHHRPLVSLQSKTAAAAAASAWLFTPERTGAILADTVSDAALKATAAAADVALDAAIVTTDTVVKTVYKAPFLSLALSFLFGGLFFSTVAAGVAAVFALGKENTRRFKEVAGILWRRNWDVFKLSLTVTKNVLLGKEKMSGFKNRFPAAIQTLKDGYTEVRRVFTESVDAIKLETQMYSAAVGLPGLIPIQYIFDRIFPSTLTAPFEGAIQDVIEQTARDSTQIRKLVLKKFTMGETAPRVLEARLFDLGRNDMAFDLEMNWKSDARVDLKLKVAGWAADIPVSIQNLRFEGPVRLIVLGLRPTEPGWEALLISLPRPPKIGFDLKVAGGLITQIPWLRMELEKMLDETIAKEVLWPRRSVVSAPSPSKTKPLLNPMQMLSLMRDDPLLRRERELMSSIPDDFRSNYEAQSDSDTNFDITTNGEGDSRDENNDEGGIASGPLSRLRFWQRGKQAKHAHAINAIELFAESLREETYVPKHVTVVERTDKHKSVLQRMLNVIYIPASLVSYASREAF